MCTCGLDLLHSPQNVQGWTPHLNGRSTFVCGETHTGTVRSFGNSSNSFYLFMISEIMNSKGVNKSYIVDYFRG